MNTLCHSLYERPKSVPVLPTKRNQKKLGTFTKIVGNHFSEKVPGREGKGSQGWGALGGGSQVQRMRGTGESVQTQTLEAALMLVWGKLIGKSHSVRVLLPSGASSGAGSPPPLSREAARALVCREGPSSPFTRQPRGGYIHPTEGSSFSASFLHL